MLHIGVLFGGKSGEHEVSLVSGTTVMANLDPARYRVSAIGVRKDGSLAAATVRTLQARGWTYRVADQGRSYTLGP